MANLISRNVAVIVTRGFEGSEAVDPTSYLEERGASVTVTGLNSDEGTGMKSATVKPGLAIDNVNVDQFDALMTLGGISSEQLRIHDHALAFTRSSVQSGKLMASICHGPQLLISAEVLRGNRITSIKTIRDA